MAKLVHNYIDKLDDLQEIVTKDSELILEQIDLNELLEDTEGYLMSLGDAFLEEHIGEIQKAHKEGIKFAEKILDKI